MTTLTQAMLVPAQLLRRSRALASMLPAFLLSGIIASLAAAVMRLGWNDAGNALFGSWTEAWLISWSIAFAPTYLLSPLWQRLALRKI